MSGSGVYGIMKVHMLRKQPVKPKKLMSNFFKLLI